MVSSWGVLTPRCSVTGSSLSVPCSLALQLDGQARPELTGDAGRGRCSCPLRCHRPKRALGGGGGREQRLRHGSAGAAKRLGHRALEEAQASRKTVRDGKMGRAACGGGWRVCKRAGGSGAMKSPRLL